MLWPSNSSGENILTSMGDEGSLCHLLLKGILHRKHTVVHDIHKILKYSSIPRADVIMFLAFKLYCTHLLSSSDHLSLGFSIVMLSLDVLPSVVILSTVVGI